MPVSSSSLPGLAAAAVAGDAQESQRPVFRMYNVECFTIRYSIPLAFRLRTAIQDLPTSPTVTRTGLSRPLSRF
jgi:hypothetical protein